uniref:tRNA-uridine aminocarboxypropyltransferase n=1 Tax=Lygus hesperus TaxID=30085 RepID=A0A0A9YUA1_LYGHE
MNHALSRSLHTKPMGVRLSDSKLCSLSTQSLEAWKHRGVGNTCMQCDLLTKYCCCKSLPDPNYLRQLTAEVFETIYVYTHFKELCTQRSSNTGKWLLYGGAKLVVYGQRDDECTMVHHLRDAHCVAVLYPTADAVTPSQFIQRCASCGPPHPSYGVRPTLVVLDATWNLAKGLRRRLEQLSELYLATPLRTYVLYVRLTTSLRGEFGTFRRKFTQSDTAALVTDKVSTLHAYCTFLQEAFAGNHHADDLTRNLLQILHVSLIGYHAQTGCRKRELIASSVRTAIDRTSA